MHVMMHHMHVGMQLMGICQVHVGMQIIFLFIFDEASRFGENVMHVYYMQCVWECKQVIGFL